MNRRGLMGFVAALAMVVVSGVGAREVTTGSRTGCACCGVSCTCPACSCDLSAKAGKACDCCGGSACCVTKVAAPRASCCEKVKSGSPEL